MIHNNWKLYAENVRDSYHATLLHTFYTTFKVNRLDMDGGIILSDKKWHHISYASAPRSSRRRSTTRPRCTRRSTTPHSTGPELLEAWDGFDDQITHSIQTIFPTLVLQLTLNSLAVRYFVPRGVDKTDSSGCSSATSADTRRQEKMRSCRQSHWGGGLVALEDGCINAFVQRGTKTSVNEARSSKWAGESRNQ